MVEDSHGHGCFAQLMNSVDGLLAIAVSDKEGSPLTQVMSSKLPPQLHESLTTTCRSFEQSNRLGFGDTKHIIAYFTNYQLICFNKGLLCVTMVADIKANTGQILNLDKDFSPIVQRMAEEMDHTSTS